MHFQRSGKTWRRLTLCILRITTSGGFTTLEDHTGNGDWPNEPCLDAGGIVGGVTDSGPQSRLNTQRRFGGTLLRLHFVFEFEASGKAKPTADYIDEFKQRREDEEVKRRREEEIRLHNVQVIQAKAPLFWQAAVEKIRADCEKMKATFPNDIHFEYQLEVKDNGFTLQHRGSPPRSFVQRCR